MHRDIDAVRQFEQQHARDHLPKKAGMLADEGDTDLISERLADWREGNMPPALAFVAVLALVAAVYLVADVVWW